MKKEKNKMKTVGYLEGTDSLFLAKLCTNGIDTLPLGNGWDNHGKYIGHITKADDISLVVGYLHKVVPLTEGRLKAKDILYSCILHGIKIVLIVPEGTKKKAQNVLKDIASSVTLVEPKALDATIKKLL